MLKSFEYSERKKDLKAHEKNLINIEKTIAMQYVLEHPNKSNSTCCPICGKENNHYFFERWEVEYRFCKECGTVFVNVDEDTEKEYVKLPELVDFRNSSDYQEQEEKYRASSWDEIVTWLSFRTYRYLGRNNDLSILDFGNKYVGFSERIRCSKLCGGYELKESSLPTVTDHISGKADLILYMNQIKHEVHPSERLMEFRELLSDDGLLVLSSRLGSGFDILTLKGGTESIFPYEHITLPSRKGLEILLTNCGYEILEITTPGTQDVDAVFNNRNKVDPNNYFVRCLLESADERTKSDFQQFLQKSCLSSFAQVIAKKRNERD